MKGVQFGDRRYTKGVQFGDRRYTKGVPCLFCSVGPSTEPFWFKSGSSGWTEVVGLNWLFDAESQGVSMFKFKNFSNSFCRYISLESYLRLFEAFVFQVVYHLSDWS